MKGKEEDEERNENICPQTDTQSSREQTENSKAEATLILCGSSGERANNSSNNSVCHVCRVTSPRHIISQFLITRS